MSAYAVNIVLCSDGSLYTGVTNDVQRRIYEHNTEEIRTSYTYHRRPVHLVYSENFNDVHEAIAAEKKIKGWSRRKKEALISGEEELLGMYCENAPQRHIRRRTGKIHKCIESIFDVALRGPQCNNPQSY